MAGKDRGMQDVLRVAVTPEAKNKYQSEADTSGQTLSEWVRRACESAANRPGTEADLEATIGEWIRRHGRNGHDVR